MGKTKILAAGDLFISRRLGEQAYEGFEEIQKKIGEYDVRFANLEMTFHDEEGYPAAESGGTWAMVEPGALDDVKRYGFNLFTTANNHSGDYGIGGILATIRHLKERDMVFAGTGENLAKASQPCYLETRNARVALIACSTNFHKAEMAGGQSEELRGRPGLNPLGVVAKYHVEPKYFDMLKEVAAETGVNAESDSSIHLGYSLPWPDGLFKMGNLSFVRDDRNFEETLPNPKDMERLKAAIREARHQADIVLVSIHSHQFKYVKGHEGEELAAQFLETACRELIDAGADAILGHGPHLLRGIEIYKNKPIFYSLGNFIFQTETVSLQPYDAYYNHDMPQGTGVGPYMSARSQNNTRGYGAMPVIWEAVMAGFTMENGKIDGIELFPVDLDIQKSRGMRGWPRPAAGDDHILEGLAQLSKPYGTEIEIRNGVGYIKL